MDEVCRHWAGLTGESYRLHMGQTIYQCDGVIRPAESPGRMRAATVEDLPQLAPWWKHFHEEDELQAFPDS